MPGFMEARELILSHVAPLGRERIPLPVADGRVIAVEAVAPWDLPRADNSAMDGYAVRAEDCRGPADLAVDGYSPAGGAGAGRVAEGRAIRIMTGAPVPEGCTAVVPLEEAEESGGRVRIRGPVRPGAHIRLRGEDVRQGQEYIPAGTVLRPPEVGLLASFGATFVTVFRRARVALLSTGDELVEPGEPAPPGAVVNSNSVALAAALREAGAEAVVIGIARDDRDHLRAMLAEGLSADALVTSAGVSAGDRDLVREVLADLGVREVFWRVAVRPGSPLAFGVKDGRPVFSLPGNPVSALVTFEEFVRPALLSMMGHAAPLKPFVKAVLTEPVRKKEGRAMFLRVRVDIADGTYAARPAGRQETGVLSTLVRADGLAFLPADRTSFEAGEKVDVHLLYPRS